MDDQPDKMMFDMTITLFHPSVRPHKAERALDDFQSLGVAEPLARYDFNQFFNPHYFAWKQKKTKKFGEKVVW